MPGPLCRTTRWTGGNSKSAETHQPRPPSIMLTAAPSPPASWGKGRLYAFRSSRDPGRVGPDRRFAVQHQPQDGPAGPSGDRRDTAGLDSRCGACRTWGSPVGRDHQPATPGRPPRRSAEIRGGQQSGSGRTAPSIHVSAATSAAGSGQQRLDLAASHVRTGIHRPVVSEFRDRPARQLSASASPGGQLSSVFGIGCGTHGNCAVGNAVHGSHARFH